MARGSKSWKQGEGVECAENEMWKSLRRQGMDALSLSD